MNKTKITLMAVLLGLLLTSQAFAWGPGDGRGCRAGWEASYEKLNLTDAQKTKIEALRDENYKATRPLREKLFDKSVELRRLWLQANPDKDKIGAAQKEMRALRNEMEDKVTALRLEIRKVLTPEQREKLADMPWDRGPGFGPRGGMRGPGHHGAGPGLGMGMCQ